MSAGDEVKKGDLLVSGRIDILDDAGTVINYQYTKSDADIYGYTSYTYSDRFPLTYEKKEPTGNSTKRYGVELAGKRIQVPWIKPDYASSDKSTDYRQLNLFSDFYLPITLCVDTYTEYKTSKVKYTKSEAENEAKKHLEAYLKKFIEKDIQILEKNVIIDINEEYCSCSGVIQTCEKIGKSVRTEQLSVPADEGQNTDELE